MSQRVELADDDIGRLVRRRRQVVDEAGAGTVPDARAVFDTVAAWPLSTADWLQLLVDDVGRRRRNRQGVRTSTSLNAATVSRARRDPRFRALLGEFDYTDVDGRSLVYWSRLTMGATVPERIATTDFIHDAAAIAAAEGISFFLLGATEASNRRAAARLQELYPGLVIAGRHHGYFDSAASATVIDEVNESRADVVWVALGVPREQYFIQMNRQTFTRAAWVKSCGGCFDFLSEQAPRAPRWMQDVGLEWSFRLANEPRRLFWRYATTNPHAVLLMLQQIWRERRWLLRGA